MPRQYIMALDEGTSSCRALLFNKDGEIIASSSETITNVFPAPGWVEQDATELFESQLLVCKKVLEQAQVSPDEVAGIGITNQRETTILWEKATGKPIAPAIVWQCRRTADYCREFIEKGYEAVIREKTGLKIDAYFSASKIAWLLKNIPGARKKAEDGELLFGTVDTWLLWNLTNGKVHATDCSNAARTMLFNINTMTWDLDLLELFDIPECILPEVRSNSEIYGETTLLGSAIPVSGMAGDQQAALFGQGCYNEGDIKTTYGTGCFMLRNIGNEPVLSQNGLITTVGWSINHKVTYAMEGSVFMCAAAINWGKDVMHLFNDFKEAEAIFNSVPDSDGVTLVPAFTGLGAPYWSPDARGIITGITLNTKPEHMVRALFEGIAYQANDIYRAMAEDTHSPLTNIKVDGGVSKNDFLMDFQSAISEVKVIRSTNTEATAWGAAALAGLATGFWKDISDLPSQNTSEQIFNADIDDSVRRKLLAQWQQAVMRCKGEGI